MSRILTALRLQRFEAGAAILVALVVSTTAVIVRWRLDAVGVPLPCLTPWIYGIEYDEVRCEAQRLAWSAIREDEAKHVLDAMAVAPYVLGLVLGVGLVAREIETGTASLAWSLAGSRTRWLVQRLLPILGLLLLLLVILAVASWVLAAGMHPWLGGRPTFEHVLYQGPDLIGVGLAMFGIAVLVGAWSGRMLPVVVTSALLALILAYGSYRLFTTWVEASAYQMPVPGWFNGEYDGGTFTDVGYRLPDGSTTADFGAAYALAPSGSDEERSAWVEANVPKIAVGVVAGDYPSWVATLLAVFGGCGLMTLGATFVVIDRRRPF